MSRANRKFAAGSLITSVLVFAVVVAVRPFDGEGKSTNITVVFNGSGGRRDDSAALTTAVRRFQKAPAGATLLLRGKILYQRPGGMTFDHLPNGAAILVRGGDDKTIRFARGAELLMNNLDSAGDGTSNGIAWTGRGENDTITGADIRWLDTPASRSEGYGIDITGYPSYGPVPRGWKYTTGPMLNFRLTDWYVAKAPQGGAIFMGCAHPTVLDGESADTLADGLHFNADNHVVVDHYTGINTGDDGLAFVTYYNRLFNSNDLSTTATYFDRTKPSLTEGPFDQPAPLGSWSDTNSVASNIYVSGGQADGVRISGAKNVRISRATISNKPKAGVIVDSAIANGKTVAWSYLASVGVSLSDVTLRNCALGFLVAAENVSEASAAYFRDFKVRATARFQSVRSSLDNFGLSAAPGVLPYLKRGVVFPSGAAIDSQA